MDFYNTLADHYDSIFPHRKNKEQLFLKNIPVQSQVLDVGCATGEMAIALAQNGHNTKGIDLNQKMVKMAVEKAALREVQVNFQVMDMLEIGQNFEADRFDLIYCIGNTLPHLDDLNQVQGFLSQTQQLLKRKGKILVQTVNFDKMVMQGIKEFPLIEADEFLFQREYEFNNEYINFKAKLTDKTSGTSSNIQTKLLPLTEKKLQKMLRQAGFANIHFSGDFSSGAYDKMNSPACIVVAELV